MILRNLVSPLFIFFLTATCCTVSTAQSFAVGSIQNGNPVMTINSAQFNSTMSAFFPGKTYSNLELLSTNDARGKYYYLKADTPTAAGTVSVVIVLEEVNSIISFDSSSGCEMACKPSGSDAVCEREIIERCKSMRCSCKQTDGSGGGTSIAFPK